jgi:long-chain acyl-CoA synthetase
MPEKDMTIVDGFRSTIASGADKTAIVCGDTRLTFPQLGERVNRLSSAFSNLGIRLSDRAAVLSFNCHRFFELYFALPQIGVSVVPINFRIPPSEVKYIVEHSGSRLLFVDSTFRPLIDEIRSELSCVEHFILMSGEPAPGYISYEGLIASASTRFDIPQLCEDTIVGLFYTSGTTGEPKGVMLSHSNLMSNVRNSDAVYPRTDDDVYLHAAPMFHLADAATVFSAATNMTTHVFIPRFDPTAVLEAISRNRVTTIMLVPTMINFILQQPDLESYDLSSLRFLIYGASPIAPDLLRRAMPAFGCEFYQGYGLTEASPLLTVLGPEDHLTSLVADRGRLASCGKPAPGVEVRVVRDDGKDVSPGQPGEIIARGPNIMMGYWRRPEETAAAIRDGWLYTGDLATVDEDGYIYLVDRKKDMIVTGGENVFSTEVEAVLYEHPAIKEAAVIPVPDSVWGEGVHACVALVDGKQLTQEELIAFCKDKLAGYKLPRSVEFFDGELPKGGTGKILKKELRARHWAGRNRRIG